MNIEPIPGGFSVKIDGAEFLRHTEEQPALQIAWADFHYSSQNGQHTINNKLKSLISLPGFELCDNQIHLFSGKEVASGTLVIDCPLGKPPVFYRKDTPFTALFQSICEL